MREFRIEDGHVFYVTSRSVEIECLPVAGLLDTARSGVQTFEPPTFTITDVAGVEGVFPYDAETIKGEEVPEEDKEAWHKYIANQEMAETEINLKSAKVVCLKGIKETNPRPLEEWLEEYEFLEILVPESPIERRFFYAQNEIFGTQEDMKWVMLGIYKASGVDQEVLDGIEDMFRAQMGRQEGTEAEPVSEDLAGEDERQEEGVVVELVLDTDRSTLETGDQPGPVGTAELGIEGEGDSVPEG